MARLREMEERFDEFQKIYKEEKSTFEYCQRENEQLKNQNEHLLSELARLAQIENRDRTRSMEQADLRRQYEELLSQYNDLNETHQEMRERFQENNLDVENDLKHLNDENVQIRMENEQLRSANDLLREEMNQMKQSHDTILRKRLEEIKYLQNENRDLQMIRQKYNEDRETFQAIEMKKTQLENDLLTMQVVEDRCQDLQSTVERLQTEIQQSVSPFDIILICSRERNSLLNECEKHRRLDEGSCFRKLKSELSCPSFFS